MKKVGISKPGIKNKKAGVKKRAVITSALFLALNLSAMDAELQLLVEQPGAISAPACDASAQSDAGAQEDAELYKLIGEHNKHFFEGHDTQQILQVFEALKLEQHLSFMALKQFNFEEQPPRLVRRRKHHTTHSKHTQAHKLTTHLQGDDLSGHAKQRHDQIPDDGQEGEDRGRSSEREEKEREQEQDRAVLEKGRELAQAEFIAALLSVLSQQHKERADKLAQEKEKTDSELKEHKEQAVQKDKCAKCLKRTTALVGILGILATAWATVMTSLCSQQSNGK